MMRKRTYTTPCEMIIIVIIIINAIIVIIMFIAGDIIKIPAIIIICTDVFII